MPRLNRLTEILIQLQSKRIIKAQEIADRFDISLRTVYRDIKALEEAGVPILSEAGVGYSIMKEYRLPPVQFSEEEALSFLTADKLISKYTDVATKKSFESALYKIKSVLKNNDKELLDDADKHIAVLANEAIPRNRNEQLNIKQILDAILKKKVIRIEYFSGSQFEKSKRDIEPIGIYAQRNNWYLIAWCRLRNDYRNFRIDRVVELTIQNERYQKTHPSLNSFLEKTRQELDLTKIVIRLDKDKYAYIGDQHYYMGFVSQRELDAQVEMTFLCASLEGFAHWYMNLGGAADIVEPDSLKEKVLMLIGKTKTRLLGKT